MLDYDRSVLLAHKLGFRYDPQCCWSNAVQVLRLYQKQLGNVKYVEGWCAMPDLPGYPMVAPHGWLELKDGTILDPTYAMRDEEDGVRYQYDYFPALYYTREALKGVRRSSLPRVWKTHGFNGHNSEEYQAAMHLAYRSIGVDLPRNESLAEYRTRIERAG